MEACTKIVFQGGVELTVQVPLEEAAKVLSDADSKGWAAFTRADQPDVMVNPAHVLYLEEESGEVRLTEVGHEAY